LNIIDKNKEADFSGPAEKNSLLFFFKYNSE